MAPEVAIGESCRIDNRSINRPRPIGYFEDQHVGQIRKFTQTLCIFVSYYSIRIVHFTNSAKL